VEEKLLQKIFGLYETFGKQTFDPLKPSFLESFYPTKWEKNLFFSLGTLILGLKLLFGVVPLKV